MAENPIRCESVCMYARGCLDDGEVKPGGKDAKKCWFGARSGGASCLRCGKMRRSGKHTQQVGECVAWQSQGQGGMRVWAEGIVRERVR